VLVLENCGDPLLASRWVEAVLARLAESFAIEDQILFVSAGAGVAMATAGDKADDLVANASLALHDARSAGRKACRLYVPQLRAKAHARRQLDLGLRRAGEAGEFRLYFQPQVRASDGSVTGAEALLRWQHPQKGILAPGAFIDALANSAVAPDVGKWILTTACQSAAGWREIGLPQVRVAVNLFPAQFHGQTLLRDVEHALSVNGLPPEALELEITENIALDLDASVLASLSRLRARGVGIAFDDFGTGFASLSYLTRFPLTRIKIDRSFVQNIVEAPNREDTAVVRSIIAMASNLGLEVTAEGVETPAQMAFLQAEGCHELQGFLFSRPLDGRMFEQFLASRAVPPVTLTETSRLLH